MTDDPKFMQFEYSIDFERTEKNYRLIGYNTPWDGDRELDDLRLIFEGKDLQDQEFPNFKIVDWEGLDKGKYKLQVIMTLYKPMDGPHEQLFKLKGLVGET